MNEDVLNERHNAIAGFRFLSYIRAVALSRARNLKLPVAVFLRRLCHDLSSKDKRNGATVFSIEWQRGNNSIW